MNFARAIVRVALAAAAMVPTFGHAQDFPSKPIKLLIPYPPGGGTDMVARVLSISLAEVLKVPVVAENRPGAAGNLAVALAAQAAPDGYTLVVGQSDNMSLGPHLYAKVGYDTVKSFAPIVQVSEAPLIIVSNAAIGSSKVKIASVGDLLERGRTADGLSWGTSGNGGMGHLLGEQLKSVTGIKLLQVAYKGAAPAITDLMAGQVDVAIQSVPSVLSFVKGGKLTPVAVTTSKRSALLPETPTLAEAGIKGVETGIWVGLFAPAGTPSSIVAKLNAEVNKVLQMPGVREKIHAAGAVPVGGSSEDFSRFVQSDYAKWGKIVKATGVRLE